MVPGENGLFSRIRFLPVFKKNQILLCSWLECTAELTSETFDFLIKNVFYRISKIDVVVKLMTSQDINLLFLELHFNTHRPQGIYLVQFFLLFLVMCLVEKFKHAQNSKNEKYHVYLQRVQIILLGLKSLSVFIIYM